MIRTTSGTKRLRPATGASRLIVPQEPSSATPSSAGRRSRPGRTHHRESRFGPPLGGIRVGSSSSSTMRSLSE